VGLADWLRRFKVLHARARAGTLDRAELATYHGARDELARALLAAQRLTLAPGLAPRRSLRVARALQADLEFHDGTVRAITLDVSSGGFSSKLAKAPRVDDEVKVMLRVPGGEPVRTTARALDVKPLAGTHRVAFRFVSLSEEDAERIELYVFDAVLEQLHEPGK
jgi:hypothetical protein